MRKSTCAAMFLVAVNICFAVPAFAQTPPSLEDLSFSTLMLEAESGDAETQNILGSMYSKGIGVIHDDVEAVKWFRQSAEQGNERGQFSLGEMYAEGRGVEKDDAEALKWYLLSAEQGNAEAQSMLGNVYENGGGIEKDNVASLMWYLVAGENGRKDAKESAVRVSAAMSSNQKDEAQGLAKAWLEKHPSNHPGSYYWERWEDEPPPVIIRK